MNLIRFFLIALWSVVCIFAAALVVLFTFQQSWAIRMAYTIWSPVILFVAGVKLKVRGVENIDTKRSYIFVANHQSFIDIPVLFRALPVNLHFMAKKEIKKLPFIGWFMMLTGMIFIDRSNRKKAYESMKKAGVIIKKGKSVLAYPEGTRSKDGKIGLFKKGSFVISTENNIPVVPIAIRFAENIWPTGTTKLYPGVIEVEIGKPVMPLGKDAIEFANQIQKEIVTLRSY